MITMYVVVLFYPSKEGDDSYERYDDRAENPSNEKRATLSVALPDSSIIYNYHLS